LALKWQAALQDEIKPLLPIHRGDGWISALYNDGVWSKVNLEMALLDASKIVRLELKNSAATGALYRILLSIVYEPWDTWDLESPDDWATKRLDLYKANNGFDKEWVNNYFDRFDDRFYLIHGSTPFFGDLSLYLTYEDDDRDKFRTNVSDGDVAKPVARQDPLLIKRAVTESKELALWGLPQENRFKVDAPDGSKIYELMSSLLYIRYATTAVPRSIRKFFDDSSSTKKASKIHAFRGAPHYLPETGSLYRDLLLAMKYTDTVENDTPEWERDIGEKKGLLKLLGYNVTYDDLVLDLTAPRSSVNITNHAGMYVPEMGQENGGEIRYVWGVPFDSNGADLPVPPHWNPYVAWWKATKPTKTNPNPQNKAVKISSYMAESTFFGSPSSKVIYSTKNNNIINPEVLETWQDEGIRDVFQSDGFPKLRILIFGLDAGQDKSFCNFSILTKDYVDELTPVEKNYLDDWMILGEKIALFIAESLSDKVIRGFDNSLSSNIDIKSTFWENYNEIFQRSLSQGISSPTEFKTEIFQLAEGIFSDTTYLKYVDPFQYTGRLGYIKNNISKTIKGM
jgi:hypothetical protein